MNKTSFNRRIKQLRLARGLSLRQMAVELAKYDVTVSHNAIAKWELDKSAGPTRLPSKEVISALCSLFNVLPSFLMSDIFKNTTSSASESERLSKLFDVELLSDEEFESLITLKNLFIKNKQIDKNLKT